MKLFPHELRSQLRLYWRSRELAFFTFLLPIIMFVLLGSVYGKDRVKPENVRGSDYLLAGMLGYGAISIGFASRRAEGSGGIGRACRTAQRSARKRIASARSSGSK